MRRGVLASLLVAPLFATAHPLPVLAQEQGTSTHSKGLIRTKEVTYRSFPASPTYRAFLPAWVDLSKRLPPVGEQGVQGSCVGWAVGYAARSYYANWTENRDLKLTANRVSPAYIYDTIRPKPDDCKEGSLIPDALNLLGTGAVSQKDYPYVENRCERPPEALKSRATDFPISSWVTVDQKNPDQIKAELYSGNPVIIGMKAPSALDAYDGRDIYQGDPGYTGDSGHAVTVVGYDERKQAFRLINSWGRDWGDDGYFWMSYDAVVRDVNEAYAMRVDQDRTPKVVVPEPQPSPIVPRVACGRIEVTELGGKKSVSGFVGDKTDFKQLSDYAEKTGAMLDVAHYPWPQCEIAATLAEVSTANAPAIRGGRKTLLTEGDKLRIDVKTPDEDRYLQITYIQADGRVVNLTPADMALRQFRPNSEIVFGDGKDGRRSLVVKAPFGQELLVAVSSKSPLFLEERPKMETEREFLTALRKAILYGKGGEGGRGIAASFQIVETTPGKQ